MKTFFHCKKNNILTSHCAYSIFEVNIFLVGKKGFQVKQESLSKIISDVVVISNLVIITIYFSR